MKYPVLIEKDDDGFMASFPDIPEALTGGDTYQETLELAAGALVTAFEFYFEDQRPVPMPSDAGDMPVIEVPLSVWAKVLVLNGMLENRLTQTELANRMGIRKQEMQRIVNLDHATKIDTLAQAMKAMGKTLSLTAS